MAETISELPPIERVKHFLLVLLEEDKKRHGSMSSIFGDQYASIEEAIARCRADSATVDQLIQTADRVSKTVYAYRERATNEDTDSIQNVRDILVELANAVKQLEKPEAHIVYERLSQKAQLIHEKYELLMRYLNTNL